MILRRLVAFMELILSNLGLNSAFSLGIFVATNFFANNPPHTPHFFHLTSIYFKGHGLFKG